MNTSYIIYQYTHTDYQTTEELQRVCVTIKGTFRNVSELTLEAKTEDGSESQTIIS